MKSEPHGADACPCVWALESSTLIPVGVDTQLSLQGKNLDIFKVIKHSCWLFSCHHALALRSPGAVVAVIISQSLFRFKKTITCRVFERPLRLWVMILLSDSREDLLLDCENESCLCVQGDEDYECVVVIEGQETLLHATLDRSKETGTHVFKCDTHKVPASIKTPFISSLLRQTR